MGSDGIRREWELGEVDRYISFLRFGSTSPMMCVQKVGNLVVVKYIFSLSSTFSSSSQLSVARSLCSSVRFVVWLLSTCNIYTSSKWNKVAAHFKSGNSCAHATSGSRLVDNRFF